MHIEHLINAGLTEGEATIYDYLLKNGETSAGEIIRYTNLKRGNTYNIMDSLVAKGLVAYQEKNKVAHFRIENPRALLDYIERDRQSIENKRAAIESILPSLISHYQLNTNKPVVSYYEGEDGIAKVIADTLTAKGEIMQYMDLEEIHKHIKKISMGYLEKRKELGLKKKILCLNSVYAVDYYKDRAKTEDTEVRFINKCDAKFDVSMHIYDNKVSYFSFAGGKLIGVIIDDQNIANMHRHIFNDLFDKSKLVL